MLLQEEISSQPTEVMELLIETLMDLPVESTRELVLSLTVMWASFFLSSPDVYNLLQIFMQEIGSQEIGVLVCGLAFSGVELSCLTMLHISCLSYH